MSESEPMLTQAQADRLSRFKSDVRAGKPFAPFCGKCGALEGLPHIGGCTHNDGIWHGE